MKRVFQEKPVNGNTRINCAITIPRGALDETSKQTLLADLERALQLHDTTVTIKHSNADAVIRQTRCNKIVQDVLDLNNLKRIVLGKLLGMGQGHLEAVRTVRAPLTKATARKLLKLESEKKITLTDDLRRRLESFP